MKTPNKTNSPLLVSAREAAKILGIRRDEVCDFLSNIGVFPVLETATRKKSNSRGLRNHRKWSLPQIYRRLENWEGNAANQQNEQTPTLSRSAFRQPFMKKLYQ